MKKSNEDVMIVELAKGLLVLINKTTFLNILQTSLQLDSKDKVIPKNLFLLTPIKIALYELVKLLAEVSGFKVQVFLMKFVFKEAKNLTSFPPVLSSQAALIYKP